jgi:hypothetical protein
VSIAVLGSQYLSNYVRYKFIASVNPVTLNLGEVPYAVECDTAGNLYVSLIAGGTGIGVKKFTPARVRTDYSPQFSSALNHWSGMKFGPGKALYAVAAGKTFVFRIPPGGGSAVVWANGLAGAVSDIDFDQQGNVWGCGSGGVIVEVKQNLTKKSFRFSRDCHYSDRASSGRMSTLRRTAIRSSVIWSLPIIGDSLGAEQVYTDFGAHYSGYELLGDNVRVRRHRCSSGQTRRLASWLCIRAVSMRRTIPALRSRRPSRLHGGPVQRST